jgi:serine/threonine-protein kinase
MPCEEIGRGALGVIRRGEDRLDGRSVALRLVSPLLLRDLPLQALAEDVQAAAQVSHPNLAKVIAWTECEGLPCVVSEHVPGRNFAEALAAGRRLSVKQVHALGRNVAQVLAFLHARGFVHGSVQPSNVMVATGLIKLADLGLGRLAWAHRRSPSYHAPEGVRSPADDLYGLCALMYHLLTGTHPASQAQGVGLPLPSQLAADVPEALDKLLARGLHPRPELRHRGAEDLLGDLRQMVTLR